MQNAVIHHFPEAMVKIKFTNRTSGMLFSGPCFDWIQERIGREYSCREWRGMSADQFEGLSTLRLQPEEKDKLRVACPYFSEEYLDFLSNIKLHPDEQVKLTFVPKGAEGLGEIECEIKGIWKETILYEVPILAICMFTVVWRLPELNRCSQRGVLPICRYRLGDGPSTRQAYLHKVWTLELIVCRESKREGHRSALTTGPDDPSSILRVRHET